jgi:hypothetical protein
MKTSKSIMLAIATTCALGATALADSQPNQNLMREKQAKQAQAAAKAPKDQSTGVTGFFKRTGQSIMHTPTIVKETFTGDRKLVSSRGILAPPDKARRTHHAASAKPKSVEKNRG